jgi:integrase
MVTLSGRSTSRFSASSVRHASITNAAAAGGRAGALQARAGHADLSTTQRYIDLAGVLFSDEAEAAETRMFGRASSTNE